MEKFNIGGYPAAYDPVKHGPYDPARYYGKCDTPFLDLKLKDIPAWFGRREKTPRAFVGVCSRAFWRWQHKYVQPKKCGVAPFFQVTVCCMIYFYLINYRKFIPQRQSKYH
ncbi:PREDICTED: putative ATP synthase subunit f, mitochondrial [Dinoponera quadriceps]|uniref:ATP synthase subunit f, mitochondrial n=1 Tax=Dinoponera quadriceps TaxID=609295 RepID=A0A6P3Y2M5_DINQU|nr:PREDICTED: putative ATP synthase subunit f, mitochondrial [Dinoponera quadriceps]